MRVLTPAWSGAKLRRHDVAAAMMLEWRLFWRRRRLRAPVVLAALPVLLAVLVAILKTVDFGWLDPVLPRGVDIVPLFFIGFVRVLLVVLPLLLGAGLVAREVETGTLSYLLVRPLSRGSLLLGKALGAWLICSILLGASWMGAALLLLAADGFDSAGSTLLQIPSYLLTLVVGAFAYGALFTLVGLISRRPGLIGIFLAFGWESAIPFLPGLIRNFTVRFHLAALAPDTGLPLVALGTLAVPSIPTALLWLSGGSCLALAASILVFAHRDYP